MEDARGGESMIAILKSQLLLVDDHPLFRKGLAMMLANEPDLEVAAEASSATEALSVVRRMPIDLAVIDVLMPSTSGMTLATELSEACPHCKILALSVLDEPSVIASMLRCGADGYALKTQDPTAVIQAIRAVLCGSRYLPPSVAADAITQLVEGKGERPLDRLTPREREIFELLIRGSSNDQIASRLFIARRTVETHRQRIIKKLATHSLLEMIRLAAREGALADDGAQLARDRH